MQNIQKLPIRYWAPTFSNLFCIIIFSYACSFTVYTYQWHAGSDLKTCVATMGTSLLVFFQLWEKPPFEVHSLFREQTNKIMNTELPSPTYSTRLPSFSFANVLLLIVQSHITNYKNIIIWYIDRYCQIPGNIKLSCWILQIVTVDLKIPEQNSGFQDLQKWYL